VWTTISKISKILFDESMDAPGLVSTEDIIDIEVAVARAS